MESSGQTVFASDQRARCGGSGAEPASLAQRTEPDCPSESAPVDRLAGSGERLICRGKHTRGPRRRFIVEPERQSSKRFLTADDCVSPALATHI